VITFIW